MACAAYAIRGIDSLQSLPQLDNVLQGPKKIQQ